MLRKIAILGANGFVGRRLLACALHEGVSVVGIVRSEAGAETVRGLGATPVSVTDLERPAMDGLIPALSNCDGLVFTAPVSAGSAADRTDPAGLQNAIAACRAAGVPRMVFLSGLGVAHYGMNPHCTNSYFLAKLAGEVALFRADLGVTVFRPSYIFGSGDEFLSSLIRRIAADPSIEIPGQGKYRLQPVSVEDAAGAILRSLEQSSMAPRVIDLVGPEIVSYRTLIERVALAVDRRVDIRVRPVDEALAMARTTGYLGMRPHDLACLLCDEVSDPEPVAALLGSNLESIDAMLADTRAGLKSSGVEA